MDICKNCGSSDVVFSNKLQLDENRLKRFAMCSTCEACWWEIFEFAGIENLVISAEYGMEDVQAIRESSDGML